MKLNYCASDDILAFPSQNILKRYIKTKRLKPSETVLEVNFSEQNARQRGKVI